jgi:hypothetical protein
MLRNYSGKLMVYASNRVPHNRRLQSVRTAAEETARLLNLDFKMVKFKEQAAQIYVYYENGEDEPIPLYCDEGKRYDPEGICANLRRMMFVLSFHPKHSALRRMRNEIMRPS